MWQIKSAFLNQSLLKHFKSKEDLVGAAMIRLIDGASAQLESLPIISHQRKNYQPCFGMGFACVRLGGGLPFLPSTSNAVREMLMRNLRYVGRVIKLNGQLEKLVIQAQKGWRPRSSTASRCDFVQLLCAQLNPAVDYLQKFSKMDTDTIVENMLSRGVLKAGKVSQ